MTTTDLQFLSTRDLNRAKMLYPQLKTEITALIRERKATTQQRERSKLTRNQGAWGRINTR